MARKQGSHRGLPLPENAGQRPNRSNRRTCVNEDEQKSAGGAKRTVSVGIDIGGTFSDVVAYDFARQQLYSTKVPSTPPRLFEGFMRGLEKVLETAGAEPGQIDRLIHGTTIATNAVLERKGARIGILATDGFED